MKPPLALYLRWFVAGFLPGALAAPVLLAAFLGYSVWPLAPTGFSGVTIIPFIDFFGTSIPVSMPTFFTLASLAGGLVCGLLAMAGRTLFHTFLKVR